MAPLGHPEFSPLLGGLCVPPALRKCGVATAMEQGIMDLAGKDHLTRVYNSTATANHIFEHLGWKQVGGKLKDSS